jgi:thioredoxin:protein disulfide reductase
MATRQRFALILLSFGCAISAAVPVVMAAPFSFKSDDAEQPLLSAAEAFTPVSAIWRDGEVTLGIRVAPGYYLYRHTLTVDLPKLQQPLNLPEGAVYHDEFFGDVLIYRDWLDASFSASQAPASVTVRYQGCADVGVCYPPQTATLKVVKAHP